MEKGIQEKYINEFKVYLLEKNSSQGTITTYVQNIYNFFTWIREKYISNMDITDITSSHIYEYINYLTYTKKTNTVNINIAALKSIFNFLHAKKYITINHTKNLRKIRILNKSSEATLSDLDIKKLKEEVLWGGNPLHRMVIFTLCDTGTRVSELINIKLSDIIIKENESEYYLVVKHPTINKYREIILNNTLIEIYNNWMQERKKKNIHSDFLIVTERSTSTSTHACRSAINKIILKYSRKIVLEYKLTPTALRKYYYSKNLN